MKYTNVAEHWMVYDTVMIGNTARSVKPTVQGWFETLADLGSANKATFFNQRTRAVGLAYNNQDVRDQTPYAYRIFSMGITFFASSQTETQGPTDDDWEGSGFTTRDQNPYIFQNDLPHHASVILQVNQDELLKSNCLIVPPGYGPVGGGVGRGSLRATMDTAVDKCYSTTAQSIPKLTNRWDFPKPLEVSRSAALSCEVNFSEYARQFLQSMAKSEIQAEISGNSATTSKSYYGIQVSLVGERAVQQRGAYHR